MKFAEYLKDKINIILLNFFCIFLLNSYLYLIGNGFDNIILIDIVWFFILVVYILTEYSRRAVYFNNIEQLLKELDKRYLLFEVMEPSTKLVDKKYWDIIRKSNKSVIEKINQIEAEQKDYREYIESWIHEVKIPITAMELICDNNKNEVTRKIKAELMKTDNYVETALFYARSEEVYKDYFIKEIALYQVVSEIISKNKQLFIQNGITITLHLENEMVYCDEKWLAFILNQILINAVKYKNGETGQITITTKEVQNGVKLEIEDNGIGIKQSEIKRIFEKGFTGSNGREKAKSTGIGLYLCRKLCRKLELEIGADSKEGAYTRIFILFPKGSFLSKL